MNSTRTPEVRLPRPGDVVAGKYRIDAVIGAGGMGVVLAATDVSLARAVAIKFLSPAKAAREGAMPRFLREARAAASIHGEHVVTIYEVATLPDGLSFIVMELLRGADLSQVLAGRGPLPVEDAVDLVLQACEALGEAHRRGIVHRDLKPQNLFLTERADGTPCLKVLDFGISKVADDTTNLTATDVVMGTPLYMSPEQVRSLKHVDHRSDIWALGSILFELLTASPIYSAPSAHALCAMIAMDPPVPLRTRLPTAPPDLEAVILRCLHKDPMGRYSDVAALANALTQFASERGRLSVTRISRGVRSNAPPMIAIAGSVPPFDAAGGAMTTQGASLRGSAMPPHGPSQAPPHVSIPGPSLPPNFAPTTGHVWQNGTAPPGGHRGNAVLVALLGVLTGIALLAVVVGGIFLYLRQRNAEDAGSKSPVPSGGGAATTAPAVPSSVIPIAATVAPASARDAGALATAARDAGAPHPGPHPPAPNHDEEDRNAALGVMAQRNCDDAMRDMNQFAQNDAQAKAAALRHKPFVCKGATSSSCERQTCLVICNRLADQACVRDMSYVINFGPKAKY